jgi:DNA topoisomerase-3
VTDVVAAIRGGAGVVRAAPAPSPTAAAPSEKPPREKPPREKPPRAKPPAAPAATTLACPRCKQGTLVAGNRGWGCARWREGCAFVIWFEIAGHRITDAELADLVSKGKTRKRKGGRLVLDLAATREAGAARLDARGE